MFNGNNSHWCGNERLMVRYKRKCSTQNLKGRDAVYRHYVHHLHHVGMEWQSISFHTTTPPPKPRSVNCWHRLSGRSAGRPAWRSRTRWDSQSAPVPVTVYTRRNSTAAGGGDRSDTRAPLDVKKKSNIDACPTRECVCVCVCACMCACMCVRAAA